MALVRFMLRNSLLLNLFTLLVLVVGIAQTIDMRREAFPSVDFDIVMIQTPYPGASPREVEKYVTDPIEEEIEGINGIEEFNSVSIEALSLITVILDPDRSDDEKDQTITDIQRAVDRVRDLPDDLPDPPLVDPLESTDMPVIEIGLTGDGMDYGELSRYAEQLIDRLEAIDDVSDVDWRSEREKEYWVEVDPDRLQRYQIGLNHVIRTLAARNLNLPGGPIQTPQGEVLVRTVGELEGAAEIADVVLRTNDAGLSVRIGDIARVREAYEEPTRIYRTNGQPSITLNVLINTSKGDIIRLVDQVKAQTDNFLAAAGVPGLNVAYVNDMSFFVKRRLGVLVNNGAFGIALVLLVLLLFLSRGIALVTAFGLPIAFVATLLVMSYAGITVNLLSMFALIIVLGMLVDDAIIVAENIWQHYEDGESAYNATVKGTSEVLWPVTATIATTIAAFSPLLMVSGIFGKFMAEMPKVVIIALAMSLLEAMFVLPSHAYDMLKLREGWAERKHRRRARKAAKRAAKRGEPAPAPEARTNGVERHGILEPVTNAYAWGLRWALRLRYLLVVAIFALFGFSMWFAQTHMKTVLFPAVGIEAFFVRAEAEIGVPIEQTVEKFKPVEAMVADLPAGELKDFVSHIGVQQNDPNDPLTKRGGHLGQLQVFLTPPADRERTATEIIDSLRPRMAEIAREQGFVDIGFEKVRPGPPVGKPVAVRITGRDFDVLNEVADQVTSALAGMDTVFDVTTDFSLGKDEIQVLMNERIAARTMLTQQDISNQVLAAFEGQVASYIREEGERTPIRVRFGQEDRRSVQTLHDLRVANAQGQLIPLDQVARFDRAPGINQIVHRNGTRVITVTANIDEDEVSSSEVNRAIEPAMRELENQYLGVNIELGGEYEDTQESMESMQEAFLVCLGLIFVILAAQFRSITQPPVVMAAIPFGIIGVIWAFWFHGLPLSFLGFIGMIGLSGVVVNDSIVLVSFLNSARERGMSPLDAAVYAGKRRFRAVWLTTLTTVTGLMPMVYGIGGMDEFLQPAAVALGYGLIFGTVLILFFVPAVYLIRVDIANALRWLFGLERETMEVGHETPVEAETDGETPPA